MASVEATFENGVLRPLRPLRLRPGERVHIVVNRQSDPSRWDLSRLARTSEAEDANLADAGMTEWEQALKVEDDR